MSVEQLIAEVEAHDPKLARIVQAMLLYIHAQRCDCGLLAAEAGKRMIHGATCERCKVLAAVPGTEGVDGK